MERVNHHSLSDWNIQVNALIELNAAYFVSPPTSLAVPRVKTGYWEWAWLFLKPSINGCIPHGLLCTNLWMELATTNNPFFWVRAQALPPLGTGLMKPANSYMLWVTQNTVEIKRRVNNVETRLLLQTLANPLPPQQWHRIAMFWETLVLPGQTVIRLTFQVLANGMWITQAEVDDSQNLWEGSAVNLVGFNICGSGNSELRKTRLDDTEIWKRV